MTEIWKPIAGYPRYEVSNLGKVRSFLHGKWSVLACPVGSRGYRVVSLRHDGRQVTACVHRLVAETFLGDSPLSVNHINGDKLDNRLENLEFVTSAENTHHAIRTGLRDFSGERHWTRRKPESLARGERNGAVVHRENMARGESNGFSKLDEFQVRIARMMRRRGISPSLIGQLFNVDRHTIKNAVSGKTWAHVK